MWEQNRPNFVEVALGVEFADGDPEWLNDAGIEPDEFRRLLENIVEIGWGSFYAATDNCGSLTHLQMVLELTEQTDRIASLIEQLAQSRFVDGDGWGNPVSQSERDAWRTAA